MIAIIWLNAIEASRHARGFSLKVPAKPVMKTGAGVAGWLLNCRLPPYKDRAEIRTWSPSKPTI
jgi:hypothetical protein